MDSNYIDSITEDSVIQYLKRTVDAIILVDGEANTYKTLARNGLFTHYLDEKGSYHDLIEKLWFHFNNSSVTVIEDYHVFIPTSGKFVGKYSKKVNITINDVPHVIQMTIYPLEKENIYLFFLDELDSSQCLDESLTNNKVSTIQNSFLFSMYIDVVRDTTSSISVTEISDDVMNQQIKYSDWRMMIVNMIWPDDQAQFLEKTDPEYLKKNFAPGKSSSFDCLMKNLEGKYIYVKLIFCRSETNNDDDYRFVFMVQNIHDTTVELMTALKKYEDLASLDTLTTLYNHGRIETEIINAIDSRKKIGKAVSVMMLDIDYFKNVNDKYGHAVGDATLANFSKLISTYAKAHNEVAGRWGGEEFVVVCYDTDCDEALKLAEEIRKMIEEASFDEIGHITCSIGVTTIGSDDEFPDAFDRMDQALYEAKSSGRNCIRYA